MYTRLNHQEIMVRFLAYTFLFLVHSEIICGENGLIPRRSKRFVAFPEGASLSVALCMTQQVIIPAGSIFTEGVNWGISYQLPNKTTYLDNLKEKSHIVKRSERRDIYENLELIIENFGFNGKSCIMRALCEAPKKMEFNNKSISEKIIETLFRYPLDPIEGKEPDQHRHYHLAARLGRETENNCDSFVKECPISLLDISLGVLNDHFTT
ncbi:uncharacterized protein LOC123316891 [Coccinella septempunctata]|uniref:uncharacterized protein LOC123316891 n=1 Tax=Coccinella septempunctata TaxID=41139 RepID=UPI001D0661D7|nr:uncharacterized protein LOC123316891 [Coccinella septempunctata]